MTRRTVLRRGGWSLVDQALSSGSNFLLSIWVARAVGVREFGVFALVYGAFVFSLAVVRTFGGFPLIIHYSRAQRFDERVIGSAVGISIVAGALLGCLAAVVGALVGGSTAAIAFAMGASLPGLLGQDSLRYAFFGRRRPEQAAANDGIFLAVQVALFVVAPAFGPRHAAWLYVALWGAGAYVALAAGLAWSRARVRPGDVRRYVATHWESSVNFSLESAVTAGLMQGFPYVIGIGVGLTGAAAVRGSQVVLGPLLVLLQGLSPMAVVEGGHVHTRDARRLARLVDTWAVAIVLVSLGYGALALLIPDRAGHALFGATWREARSVLFAMVLAAGAHGPSIAAHLGLRTLDAPKQAFRARVASAVPLLGAPAIGVSIAGLSGGVYGYAVGMILGSGIAMVTFTRTHQRMLAAAALPRAPEPGILGIVPESSYPA